MCVIHCWDTFTAWKGGSAATTISLGQDMNMWTHSINTKNCPFPGECPEGIGAEHRVWFSPGSVSKDDHQHNPPGVIKPMSLTEEQGVVLQVRQVGCRVYPWPLGSLADELLGSICIVCLSQIQAQTQPECFTRGTRLPQNYCKVVFCYETSSDMGHI